MKISNNSIALSDFFNLLIPVNLLNNKRLSSFARTIDSRLSPDQTVSTFVESCWGMLRPCRVETKGAILTEKWWTRVIKPRVCKERYNFVCFTDAALHSRSLTHYSIRLRQINSDASCLEFNSSYFAYLSWWIIWLRRLDSNAVCSSTVRRKPILDLDRLTLKFTGLQDMTKLHVNLKVSTAGDQHKVLPVTI